MNNYSGDETVNAGTGKELTIKELTELVAKVIGYGQSLYYVQMQLRLHTKEMRIQHRKGFWTDLE